MKKAKQTELAKSGCPRRHACVYNSKTAEDKKIHLTRLELFFLVPILGQKHTPGQKQPNNRDKKILTLGGVVCTQAWFVIIV